MTSRLPEQLCGEPFSPEKLAKVKREISVSGSVYRAEIARRVCEVLGWKDALGRPKAMSARVALLRLHRAGHIELPAPRNGNGNSKPLMRRCQLPVEHPIRGSVEQLDGLSLERVERRSQSALWNGMIDRYHYLGYQRLVGAQLRYLVRHDGGLLGALGWGASAWAVKARDQWIGWGRAARERNLSKVLNNTRFLVLPWVRIDNLASKVLAMSARQVMQDYEREYGQRLVLLETFVEAKRFRGTCYRAANWQYVGRTRGRGKCDRLNRWSLPVKDIYVYPLRPDFRRALGVH